ncbi:MAG: RagB/SusD family nutrient uptake outer membrane protein [Dysgonamonadaceae bacterium]|nr:RagB/SusD family nutrient uptake outer membrane protein [Dysgonamonadaceae bacterium]
MKQLLNYTISILLLVNVSGCSSDYLDTAPTKDTSIATVFETTENAAMAVNGLAKIMVRNTEYPQQYGGGEGSIKLAYGIYPGNTVTASGTSNYGIGVNVASGSYHENSASDYTSFPWRYYYQLVSNANSILANIDAALGPEAEKQRIKAQALTYRAYAFTMLVQLYGYRWTDSNNGATPGIVLRLKPTAEPIPLSTMADTYKQIYSDLDEAIRLFQASGWTRATDDYWTPNINVAYATYARAAINRLDYKTAIKMSVSARIGYPLMTVAEYQSGFCNPNREWIWGSYSNTEQHQSWYAYHSYIAYNGYSTASTSGGCKRIVKDYYEKIPATDIRKGLFLDPAGYPSTAFDPLNGEVLKGVRSDSRGQGLIDQAHARFPKLTPTQKIWTYMQFKIACNEMPGIGYLNHFRSSEMYLIEAEAQYLSGNETRAQQLLVELTKDSQRDPAYACTKTGEDLFNEIKFMSQIELWGEGFDWFMTKRWGDRIVHKSFAQGGNFLASCEGNFGPEEKNKQTWVIPLLETDYNPLAKGLAP